MKLDKSPFVVVSVIGQELLTAGHHGASVVVLEAALKIGTCSLKLRGSVFSALSSAYWSLGNTEKSTGYMQQDLDVAKTLGRVLISLIWVLVWCKWNKLIVVLMVSISLWCSDSCGILQATKSNVNFLECVNYGLVQSCLPKCVKGQAINEYAKVLQGPLVLRCLVYVLVSLAVLKMLNVC